MIHDLKDLPALLAAAPCSLLAWVRFSGVAAMTLVVMGLEIWLSVPLRPVVNQLFAFGHPASSAGPHA